MDAVARSTRAELGRAALLGLVLSLPQLLFLAVDQRPPNDHDTWYTSGVAQSLTNAALADGPEGTARVVLDHFLFEGWHPQGAQTVLLVAMLLFGPSLLVFRAVTIGYWALLVGSSYAVGRQLRSHRFGLLTMVLVGWLPGILAYSRKWDPMLHGAAISVLGWAFALRCLRPDAARLRWPWVGLALTLGARFYTHPTGLPDLGLVAVLVPSLALLGARRRGEPPGPLRWRAAGLLLGVFALGAWFLGCLPLVPDEPSYALPHYLRWRMFYVGTGGGELSLARELEGLLKLGRSLFFWHWQPGQVLFLGLPGLIGLGRLLRRGVPDEVRMLLVLLLLQVPIVIHTFANGAVTPDWIHLTPLAVILAALGLCEVAAMPRLRRLPILAVGYAAVAALVPPAVALLGPDPLLDDRPYQSPLLEPFAHVETGDFAVTPHLLSDHTQAADRLFDWIAERSEPAPDEVLLLAVRDLTVLDGPERDEGAWCGDADIEGCCRFEQGRRGGGQAAFRPVWPARFAGWGGVDVTREPTHDRRFVLVRLWHADDFIGPTFEGQRWEPLGSTVARRCHGAARRWVEDRWLGSRVIDLSDPPGRLISRMWALRTEYAHQGFLVDRGHGTVARPAEFESPIGGALPGR